MTAEVRERIERRNDETGDCIDPDRVVCLRCRSADKLVVVAGREFPECSIHDAYFILTPRNRSK